MRTLFTTAAIVCATHCTAFAESQLDDYVLEALRVVEDADGFTNIRSGPSLKSEVAGKALTGSLVSVISVEGDWAKLDSDPDGKAGYIHTSRLRKLDAWKEIPAARSKDEPKATAKEGSMEVTVTSIPFVAKEHKVTKTEDGATVVDGKEIWGVDGGLPDKAMSLTVNIDGKAVSLPASAITDLFQPNLETLTILTPPKPSGPTIVLMQNSDGAGGYTVAWSFAGGKYVDREILGPP